MLLEASLGPLQSPALAHLSLALDIRAAASAMGGEGIEEGAHPLGGHKVEAGNKEGGPGARRSPARPVVVGRGRGAAPVGVPVAVAAAAAPVSPRAWAASPVAVPVTHSLVRVNRFGRAQQPVKALTAQACFFGFAHI